MFAVFGIVGTPQQVRDATALVDEAGLMQLCYDKGFLDDGEIPTIRLEWEHFALVRVFACSGLSPMKAFLTSSMQWPFVGLRETIHCMMQDVCARR